MDALVATWSAQIRSAGAAGRALWISAGGTKAFYGGAVVGERLDPRGYHGVVEYEPSELVVTVRAGTRLADLEALLAAHGQMLAFEPPHFGDAATVGAWSPRALPARGAWRRAWAPVRCATVCSACV